MGTAHSNRCQEKNNNFRVSHAYQEEGREEENKRKREDQREGQERQREERKVNSFRKMHVASCTIFSLLNSKSKGEKDSIMKEAVANAKLWEARFNAVEKSRLEYRENAKKLISDNETLQTAVNQVRSEL